ncbi:MAG: histidine kinase [Cytophagia bacterium]|nr:MAG: histidine kinase [Runella sp.]TAG19074.1 MAG: histidine kinase [Cytophagales bacterium]TAG38364.1 MAG: histidine kinase [Cytophagia bacterium]TAG79930.1 MAG: histidine kinase [Cytophagales bacterium]
MKTLEQQVARRLTRLYIMALTAVALLSIFGQFLIQNTLKGTLNDAHVVNIAGRQRMLSQRISKVSILLANPSKQVFHSEIYQKEMSDILPLWRQSHEGLRDGLLVDSTEKYIVKNSVVIQSIFTKLDTFYKKIYDNALKIKQNHQDTTALKIVLENEGAFLKAMNQIVYQYDLEAQERVRRIRNIELILFLFTLSILILEGFLIFKPLAKYIKTVIWKLMQSENELQDRNQEFRATNQKLVETQQDLVKTTQEKYELIRKEDKIRSAALIEGQESERKRIALDLHDGIGQMLMALKLDSERLKTLPFSNEKQRSVFAEHQKLINETIEATRATAFDLMPSVLSDFGLSAALRILIEQTAKSSELKIDFKDVGTHERLSSTIEVNLYRIVQEALNNAIKHAQTTQIDVVLKVGKPRIMLSITDFGKGFDHKKKQKNNAGNGLKNIETRVSLLNGKCQILSKINAGTTIIVTLMH